MRRLSRTERLLNSMRLSPLLLLLQQLVAVASLACGAIPTNPPHPGTAEVVVEGSKNGGTVKAHVGDVIRVTLDSTDWTFQP